MAIGDQQDIVRRLKDDLVDWFGQENPILTALLNGIGETESFIYELTQDTEQQTRIKTCDGYMLDYAALDFFGSSLTRRPDESDTAFRKRILANLLQIKATRYGMINVLELLTGNTPTIIEGTHAADNAFYDVNLFYDNPYYGGFGWTKPYTAIIYVYNSTPLELSDDAINYTIQNTKVFGTKMYVTIFNV